MAQSDPGAPRIRSKADEESRRLWRLAGMGGTLASEIAAGALIGWLLDRWLETTPTLLVICTIIGVVVGMVTFIRGALTASRHAQRDATRVAAALHDKAVERESTPPGPDSGMADGMEDGDEPDARDGEGKW